MNAQFSTIWHIDRILSGVITPDLSGPGSDGNKEVLCIPQSFSITKPSPSYCLVSYPGQSLEGSYPSTEMQSVYSTTPGDWAEIVVIIFNIVGNYFKNSKRVENDSINGWTHQ